MLLNSTCMPHRSEFADPKPYAHSYARYKLNQGNNMDRPTCKTCQYWNPDPWEPNLVPGECRLDPHPYPKRPEDWCSHHPKFKAYLQSTEPNTTQNFESAIKARIEEINQARQQETVQELKQLQARIEEIDRKRIGPLGLLP